jgi:hypothetical protein
MPLTESVSPALTRCSFTGGTEDGKSYLAWATREIVVVVQHPPDVSAARKTLSELLRKDVPKPQRQIYELVWASDEQAGKGVARQATYRLARTEAPR